MTMPTRSAYNKKLSSKGGGSAYVTIRSKWIKDKDGKPAMTYLHREMMMDKLQRPLRSDEIVAHANPGSHNGKDQGKMEIKTLGENSTEANISRKDGALYKKLKIRRELIGGKKK